MLPAKQLGCSFPLRFTAVVVFCTSETVVKNHYLTMSF